MWYSRKKNQQKINKKTSQVENNKSMKYERKSTK